MAQQMETKTDGLTAFYDHVENAGKLLTHEHAVRYTRAVLWTMALQLKGGTKKSLANALPAELSEMVTRPFWLAHFPDQSLAWPEFTKMVARRAGNSDGQFARIPARAVFQAVQSLIDSSTSDKVAQALSPEVRSEWEQARG